ncbi:hypothetical protein AC249_AIPGENE25386, partial [Exaiptasia diaphana]
MDAETHRTGALEFLRQTETGIAGHVLTIDHLLRIESSEELRIRQRQIRQHAGVVDINRRVFVEEIEDAQADFQAFVGADRELVGQVEVGLGQGWSPPLITASVGEERKTRGHVVFGGDRGSRSDPLVETNDRPPGSLVDELHLELMRTIRSQAAVDGVAVGIEARLQTIEEAVDVRRQPTVFVGAGEAGVISVQPAVGVAGVEAPAIAEVLAEREGQSIVLTLGRRLAREVGTENIGRNTLARIGDEEDLADGGIEHADVLDGPLQLLVHIASADGDLGAQHMLDTNGDLVGLHGLQIRIDGGVFGIVRRMTTIGSEEELARAARRRTRFDRVLLDLAIGDDRRPIEGIQTEEPIDPFVGAEGSTGHFQLGVVVEHTIGAVEL